jgi:hypothetical protein
VCRVNILFDGDAIRTLVTYKPPAWISVNKKHLNGPRRGQKSFALWRIHALVCKLLDTGCRIDEVLTALTTGFEQDDLLLTVLGKGNKLRRPRRALYGVIVITTFFLLFISLLSARRFGPSAIAKMWNLPDAILRGIVRVVMPELDAATASGGTMRLPS